MADIGSGGGFPGIVAAACLPDHQFTLVEPMERRIEWLHECVDEMGLDNVSIVRSRANAVIEAVRGSNGGRKGRGEDAVDLDGNPIPVRHPFARGDLPCGRAMAKLSGWTLPLLDKGGRLVALKGRSAQEEIVKATKEISKNGGIHPPRGGGRGRSGSGTDACADGGQAISYPQNRVSYPQYPQSRKCVTKHLEEAWNCNDCSVDNFWVVG